MDPTMMIWRRIDDSESASEHILTPPVTTTFGVLQNTRIGEVSPTKSPPAVLTVSSGNRDPPDSFFNATGKTDFNAVSKHLLHIEIPALTVKRFSSQLALARVPGAGHRRKMRLFTRISTPSQAVQVIEASIPTTEAVASKRPQDAAVKTIGKGKT
jgi:hypothetical protein